MAFRMFSPKRGKAGNSEIACIFVHAGAGYHSIQNEHVHLQACNDSASTAMRLLQEGGSAVDAVEMAVRILEDREITNAGYGSNLAMDGVAECDAVVVDHNGRSGGAGAVAQIKNPISLARLLLDHSLRPLSLKRVPPNFLAGQGATDFAYEHGMQIVPLDHLVSPAARDRWRKWRADLGRAERNQQREDAQRYGISPVHSQPDLLQYHRYQNEQEQLRQARSKAMGAALRNEGQPISPPPSDAKDVEDDSTPSHSGSSTSMIMVDDSSNTTPDPHQEYIDPIGPPGFHIGNRSPILFANDARKISTASANMLASNRNSNGGFLDDDLFEPDLQLGIVGEPDTTPLSNLSNQSHRTLWNDGSSGSDSTTINVSVSRDANGPRDIERGGLHNATLFLLQKTPDETMGSPTPRASTPLSHVKDSPQLPPDLRRTNNGWVDDEDRITDTVGAIAIDLYGNIACAASSGGIGMKHRGRIGPAALVSVGAAVQPEDPGDAERTTVATVTSGTGEHMSTTTAAGVCSERVFHSVRKVSGGMYEQCLEEESIRGFIEKDFMGHPSVLQSHSAGAIGVLSVKKTKDGAYLYYGHNTDSFAMASMHSNENTPVCTMSRSRGSGQVAQGGRSIRSRKRKL